MPATKFPVGSRVIIDPEVTRKYVGIVFKVVPAENLRTNVLIKDERNLDGRGLRINPDYLLPAPAAGEPTPAPVMQGLPPLPVGKVVTPIRERIIRGAKPGDPLVVLGHSGVDGHRLATLGGDRNRYWPGVSRAAIVEVPLGDALDAVRAAARAAAR
ncbi:hypothetical protein [Actinoplanes sp. URMC 104]|uniref:hypothetical protein n=1 Tax=Actinoplanes sp. URMC 104 TaxID=3423409 RepID=UPI003F1BDB14